MSQESFLYYGGVEGGASNTKFVLVRSDGKLMATSQGEGTNQYLIGVDNCLKIISSLVYEGLKKANLADTTTLEGLGMSLSGGDEKGVQVIIKETLKKDYPNLSKHYFVGSDTQSALASALPNGGVVLIAGTGSNCQLINPDGSMARCGGWGHLIGDEASACWISLKAVKVFFDHEDGFVISPHSTSLVKETIYKYYNVKDRSGMLDHLYTNFNKAKFAGLCKDLAQVGLEKNDPLCCEIFKEAGKLLARHLYGISNKIHKDLKARAGGLPVVCVGSVFKSWKLLEPGFMEEMTSNLTKTDIKEVVLLHLNSEASIGAAALGAKAAGQELPLDYANNATAFFHTVFSL
ncbi:N-acetyl-D-glucosamine kinase-like [Physella acuta]|uniref:N-acetyl-D-glucosamine kinase-like n=1 Tax=Physella acuta TaxID=109671 RepID=UPI0027DB4D7F|nr:N-acetyl-D-glucosamine kinase-like [Physella acuta]XP_059169771.1 N-acetyl-D-glucosamine kinase-like [Physella acuta]XP_059169772.1 N-acetyl-D-glucosamine kinase-like [Physella acuta]XP_059169774.1 N-acetyl-D-glucosamine kinase-like [Physella acuta]